MSCINSCKGLVFKMLFVRIKLDVGFYFFLPVNKRCFTSHSLYKIHKTCVVFVWLSIKKHSSISECASKHEEKRRGNIIFALVKTLNGFIKDVIT